MFLMMHEMLGGCLLKTVKTFGQFNSFAFFFS